MSLTITRAGEYENSYFCLSGKYFQPQYIGREGGYYGVLARNQPKDVYDRVATFAVIADKFQIASADWSFREPGDGGYAAENPRVGVAMSHKPIGEWDDDVVALAAMLLAANAIPEAHLVRMTSGLKPGGQTERFGMCVDAHAHQYLCRLLHQIRTLEAFSSTRLFTKDDHDLLDFINQFVLAERWPLPFALPDARKSLVGSAPHFGVLLFSPPDFQSLVAARDDHQIRKYASKVAEFLRLDPSIQEQKMFEAMQEAMLQNEVAVKSRSVFEAQAWAWRALHFVPFIGKIAFCGEIIADLAKRWAEKKEHDGKWYAIATNMREIAWYDYLRRRRETAGQINSVDLVVEFRGGDTFTEASRGVKRLERAFERVVYPASGPLLGKPDVQLTSTNDRV